MWRLVLVVVVAWVVVGSLCLLCGCVVGVACVPGVVVDPGVAVPLLAAVVVLRSTGCCELASAAAAGFPLVLGAVCLLGSTWRLAAAVPAGASAVVFPLPPDGVRDLCVVACGLGVRPAPSPAPSSAVVGSGPASLVGASFSGLPWFGWPSLVPRLPELSSVGGGGPCPPLCAPHIRAGSRPMSTVSTRSVPPPFRQVVSGLVCCLGAKGCNGSWFPRHTSPSPYCKSCTEFVNSTLADADMVAWHVVELHEVCLRDDRKHVTATATPLSLSLPVALPSLLLGHSRVLRSRRVAVGAAQWKVWRWWKHGLPRRRSSWARALSTALLSVMGLFVCSSWPGSPLW